MYPMKRVLLLCVWHVATGHVPHEKSTVAVHVACSYSYCPLKRVLLLCMWHVATGHVPHEKSAVAVHVACSYWSCTP